MNTTQAVEWIENTPGLVLIVGKKQEITITNGMTVRVTGTTIVGTVIELQDVLKQMREAGQ